MYGEKGQMISKKAKKERLIVVSLLSRFETFSITEDTLDTKNDRFTVKIGSRIVR